MIGAIEIARMLPDRIAQEKVLANARDFLLHSFRFPKSIQERLRHAHVHPEIGKSRNAALRCCDHLLKPIEI
jgi:hypothetical protein